MIHHVEVQVLVLLLIASLVGMGARRLRLPYTLALVVAGLVLGFAHLDALHGIQLDADLLLLLFLPALLFEAALHIELGAFRRELPTVLTLAFPGVLLAVGLTALLSYAGLSTGLVPEFGVEHAILLAAVIAATDPISVLALFKELGVSKRLYMLVEGESLLNDGVAVVVFTIAMAVLGLSEHAHVEPGLASVGAYGLRTFVWMAGGGVLIGAIVGAGASFLTRHVDDHLVEVTLTTLVAYGSFLLAETVHASGVLSTVTAGIIIGSVGTEYGMTASTRVAVEDFWEYMAFLANSFVFLLVGLELDPAQLLSHAPAILVAFVAVVIGRATVIYGLLPVAARFGIPVPMSWRHVMVWGGLRGSLSMVLILTVPAEFPGRSSLIAIVFGVVALSLFGQGLTIGPLLSRLGLLRGAGGSRASFELAHGRSLAAMHALHTADHLQTEGILGEAAARRLTAWYTTRRDQSEAEALEHAGTHVWDEQLVEGLVRAVDAERHAIREGARTGILSPLVAHKLTSELNARTAHLEHLEGLDEVERRDALRALLEEGEG